MKRKLYAVALGALMLFMLPKANHAATMTTLGDSINCGWLPGDQYVTPYGKYASSQLKMTFSQSGQPGNMVVVHNKYKNKVFADLI